MAFRFWRRVKIAPGLTLNLSKSGRGRICVALGLLMASCVRTEKIATRDSGDGHRVHDKMMEEILVNGKNLVRSLIARDGMGGPHRWGIPFEPGMPISDGEGGFYLFSRDNDHHPVETSTDAFRRYVDLEILNVYYSFFSAPGIKKAHTVDGALFTSEHNAWCIVTDMLFAYPDDTPVLFTRNLLLHSLDGTPELTDSPPFGKQGVLVVMKTGQGRILREEEIEPFFRKFREMGMTSRVLRP